MRKINLVIVDDHPAIREVVRSVLSIQDDTFHLLGEFENGVELIPFLRENKPDVILLDLDMPKMNGVETLKHIRNEHGLDQKVIMFTAHDEKYLIYELLKLKINGVIFKESLMSILKEVIVMVHNGNYCIPNSISSLILDRVQEPENELSDRELEMIKLICDERTSDEIADAMCISSHSVNQMRSKLLKKTNSKNIAGLVRYAIKNGICN